MAASELLELAKNGKYDEFETRCLELLEASTLGLADLVGPFQQLEKAGHADKLGPLVQMVLETVKPESDPPAALELGKITLIANPKDEDIRKLVVELYRTAYGDKERFSVVLDASGLAGGRPVRMALRLLDVCLLLEPGDTLISRMDDRVVEVAEIDRANGLFTLRREGRATTRPAEEVVREYERIAPDDFRVMRQMRPEKLAALMDDDPVAVVIGLIHAHGGLLDAEVLKHELVPRYVDTKAWSKWWTRARNLIKHNPHVIMEGRSPVILSYTAKARTLEDETWEAIENDKEPTNWLTTIERYIKDRKTQKEAPDPALLKRFHDNLAQHIAALRSLRPADALACALMIEHLADKGVPATDETRAAASDMLRDLPTPHETLMQIQHDSLRDRGFEKLQSARPDDWVQCMSATLPLAPAPLLDKLATAIIDADQSELVQRFVDQGLSDIAEYPEVAYWLWKGPKKRKGLTLPPDEELFRMIMDTLAALGRTVSAEPEIVREFRQRMRAALALRNGAKAKKCLTECSQAAAVTLRYQIDRLEGMGDTVPSLLIEALRDAHPQLWVVKRRQLAPWEDTETIWATNSGLTKRTAERDEIVNVKMRENAKRIGEAASHGDLSENSEYKFAIEERDLLRARLAAINDELSRVRTLDAHDVPEDHVGIGTRVRLRRLDENTEHTMSFFGPFETDIDRGIYSYKAPFAQKLMGTHPGDRVRVTLDGAEVELEVLEISNAMTSPAPQA